MKLCYLKDDCDRKSSGPILLFLIERKFDKIHQGFLVPSCDPDYWLPVLLFELHPEYGGEDLSLASCCGVSNEGCFRTLNTKPTTTGQLVF